MPLPEESDEDYIDDPIRLIDFEQRTATGIVANYNKATNDDGYDPVDSNGDVLIERNMNKPGPHRNILPVTFFDIPRNVQLLRECCPVTVKVIKFDKYPSYQKQYLKKIQKEQDEKKQINKTNTYTVSINCEKEAMKQKILSVNTPYPILKNTANSINYGSEGWKNIKEQALTQKNVSLIDLKKNQGLIGLRIKQLDNLTFSKLINHDDKMDKNLTEQAQNRVNEDIISSTFQINTDVSKVEKVVDAELIQFKSTNTNDVQETKTRTESNKVENIAIDEVGARLAPILSDDKCEYNYEVTDARVPKEAKPVVITEKQKPVYKQSFLCTSAIKHHNQNISETKQEQNKTNIFNDKYDKPKDIKLNFNSNHSKLVETHIKNLVSSDEKVTKKNNNFILEIKKNIEKTEKVKEFIYNNKDDELQTLIYKSKTKIIKTNGCESIVKNNSCSNTDKLHSSPKVPYKSVGNGKNANPTPKKIKASKGSLNRESKQINNTNLNTIQIHKINPSKTLNQFKICASTTINNKLKTKNIEKPTDAVELHPQSPQKLLLSEVVDQHIGKHSPVISSAKTENSSNTVKELAINNQSSPQKLVLASSTSTPSNKYQNSSPQMVKQVHVSEDKVINHNHHVLSGRTPPNILKKYNSPPVMNFKYHQPSEQWKIKTTIRDRFPSNNFNSQGYSNHNIQNILSKPPVQMQPNTPGAPPQNKIIMNQDTRLLKPVSQPVSHRNIQNYWPPAYPVKPIHNMNFCRAYHLQQQWNHDEIQRQSLPRQQLPPNYNSPVRNYFHCAPIYNDQPQNMNLPKTFNAHNRNTFWNCLFPPPAPPAERPPPPPPAERPPPPPPAERPPPPPLAERPPPPPYNPNGLLTKSNSNPNNCHTTSVPIIPASKSVEGSTIIGQNISGPIRKINITTTPKSKPGDDATVKSKKEMLEELSKITIIANPPQSPCSSSKINTVIEPTILKNESNEIKPYSSPKNVYLKADVSEQSKSDLNNVPQNAVIPHKGYSPAILPIPTYEKTFEMLKAKADMSDLKRFINHEEGITPKDAGTPELKSKHSNKRKLEEKRQEKSLKKISLDEYKKRVTNFYKVKKEMKNENSEQDLGYDSDGTVKL